MIREATVADIPAVMEMGKRFADDAGVTRTIGWDDASVETLLHALIESDDGVLLVGDRGMIGGVIYAHPFNNAVRLFQEFFWRSEGAEGIKLLRRAEELAHEKGATRSYMGTMPDLPSLDKLMPRLGYTPAERTYIKEI